MKKRILSLLLSLIMVLSLLPTTAWADWRDDWGFGGGSYPGITTNTVDHIDIAVAITDPTDATRTIILTQNMAETIVIKDSNGTTYAPTSYSTSDDGKGNNQIRMEGTFPVGTRTAPVTYTLTLDLTINSVKYTVSVNANYWNGSNVCPGTYKGANPKNDRTDAWTTGTTVDKQSRAGIDTEFGTPEATNKQVTITKVIAGVAETDLVAGKTFVFEISQGNTVNGTATVTTTAGETSAGAIVYLPEGSYTVTEKTRSDYEDYDFVSTTPSSGTLTVGANGGSITVTNTYEKKVTTGSLTINKVLAGDGASAAANKEFTFTVKDAAGNVVSTKTITGAGSATVDSLPVGGTYTVTESGADITGYDLTTEYNGDIGTSYGVTIGGTATQSGQTSRGIIGDIIDSVSSCGCGCEDCPCTRLICRCNSSCCDDCMCGGSTEQPDQPQPDQPSTPTTPSATVTVTNTYTKEKTSVTVEKAWSDSNNKYNTRPTSITVQLLADGQSVSGKTATLTAANNWMATFSNLDKYSYSASGATEIAYSVEETSFPADYTASVDGYKITNTLNTGDLTITKAFSSNVPAALLTGKTFTFSIKNEKNVEVETATITGAGTATVSGLPIGQYTVAETSADDIPGFTLSALGSATATVSTTGGSATVTNNYTQNTTSINVEKKWGGDDDYTDLRPESITVQLLADGTAVSGKTLTLNAGSSWKGTFADLPTHKDGQEITYTVQEVNVSGYKSEVSGNAANGFTITNTADWADEIVNKASVTVTKYNDDKTIKLAGAEFTLYKWNETTKKYDIEVGSRFTSSEEATKGELTFTDLLDGKYQLVETEPPAGYQRVDQPVDFEVTATSVTDTKTGKFQTTTTHKADKENITFTNKALTSIIVTKAWDDQSDKYGLRPETVTVQLYKNSGAYGDPVTLQAAADGKWEYTFNNLLVYDDQNEAISYTVAELNVDSNYTADVNGYAITNTLNTGNLRVKKAFSDNVPEELVADKTFKFEIKDAQGEKVTEVEITGEASHLIEKLPVGTYTVTEIEADDITGFELNEPEAVEVTVAKDETVETTITNTYEHETIDIPVTKVWEGDEKNPELRPASITVKLMNGETVVDTKSLTAENEWKATFEDVRKYDDNNALITYTVVEEPVANYKTGVVTANNDGSYTITNELAPVTYEAKVNIEKIVKKTGGNVAPGKEEFVFVAYYKGAEKNELVGEARIITDGVNTYISEMGLTVPASAFNLKDGNGEITLYVSEVKGSSAGWKYDDTVYTLVMTVENYVVKNIGIKVEISVFSIPDGQGPDGDSATVKLSFTNEFSQTKTPNRPHKPSKPITSVKTGDAGVAMYAMSGLLSLGGAALFMKKRKDEE